MAAAPSPPALPRPLHSQLNLHCASPWGIGSPPRLGAGTRAPGTSWPLFSNPFLGPKVNAVFQSWNLYESTGLRPPPQPAKVPSSPEQPRSSTAIMQRQESGPAPRSHRPSTATSPATLPACPAAPRWLRAPGGSPLLFIIAIKTAVTGRRPCVVRSPTKLACLPSR